MQVIRINLMKRINTGLLLAAAISSVVFLFIVESFNNLTLDDIGFALILKKESIWHFIIQMYLTWQGRFMGFLITGIQMKSYFLFNSMIPASILVYVLCIFLVSRSLVNFFKIGTTYSLIYAIIFFQLFIFSMFDISSYFWMCTKGYTIQICLGLFAISEFFVNKGSALHHYIILFIAFAFLGCSYEIYAPIILLLLGCILLFRLHLSRYDIILFANTNRKLLFSFGVCLLFFILMLIAPGNWIRMKEHAKAADLLFSDYLFTVGKNSLKLLKLLFKRWPYFVTAGLLLWTLFARLDLSRKPKTREGGLFKRIFLYGLIAGGLCLVSLALNTYAVGGRMELRAFNHINLICLLFLGFSLYELSTSIVKKKPVMLITSLSLLFIIYCNIYASVKAVPELNAYRDSVNERYEIVSMLQASGNREIIKLSPLKAARFHSVDDLWKLADPKYTPRLLLNPNEVSNNTENYYNKSFRGYYKLDFDVITEFHYDL